MNEFNDPKEELKRADHLIYITLKYTRTADVIKSILHRLVNAYECAVDEALIYAKDIKLIKTIPQSFQEKTNLLEKVFPDTKQIKEYIKNYYLIKKINESPHTTREEYRKNITLLAGNEEVNVERIKRFYNEAEEFVGLIKEWTVG